MKEIKDYIDYQLDLLFEAYSKDEVILVLSDRLQNIIGYIDSPISGELLIKMNDTDYTGKITLLDINDKVDSNGIEILDSISFITSNKIYDYIATNKVTDLDYNRTSRELTPKQYDKYGFHLYKYRNELFDITGRSETSLGRIIKKILGDKYNDSTIEDFVNKYKTLRQKPKFELVEGEDISKWYNEENYTKGGGSINTSCMRYNKCKEYIKFYSENIGKVKLLILKDSTDDTLISGRALVWNSSNPENRIFMDRIYTSIGFLENHFKNYAKNNGWIYKTTQDMHSETDLLDTKTGEILNEIEIDGVKETEKYPYMDTLKYFYHNDGILSNYIHNDLENGYKLESTQGTYSYVKGDNNIIWSEYYGEELNLNYDDVAYCDWINDYRYYDDCFYSDFYNVSIDYEYAKSEMIRCEYSNDDEYDNYRLSEDTMKMYDGEYATIDWAEDNNVKYSDYLKGGIKAAVWSAHYNSWIGDTDDKYVVDVRMEPYRNTGYKDWRYNDDGTYYEYEGREFDNSIKKEDITE